MPVRPEDTLPHYHVWAREGNAYRYIPDTRTYSTAAMAYGEHKLLHGKLVLRCRKPCPAAAAACKGGVDNQAAAQA